MNLCCIGLAGRADKTLNELQSFKFDLGILMLQGNYEVILNICHCEAIPATRSHTILSACSMYDHAQCAVCKVTNNRGNLLRIQQSDVQLTSREHW